MAARECQLHLAEDASPLGVWTLEPATGDLSWSPRCRTLLGASADAESTFDALLERVCADDQPAVRRAFAQAAHLRREFSIEFRTLEGSLVRCAGRPHASVASRDGVALSGILTETATDAATTRVGAVLSRMDRLREVERHGLADRLQSDVAQRIAALQSQIESLAVNATVPAATRAELVALSATAAECADAVRGAIFEISPPGVQELGFAGALERYAADQAGAAGMRLAFEMTSAELPVDQTVLESLYAVARAGIDNVVRHSRARNMRVIVKCDDEELALCVEDDGIGISRTDLMKESAFGLFASSERLADSGGELRVTGKPNQGTVLEASIALRQRIRPLRQNVTKLRVA